MRAIILDDEINGQETLSLLLKEFCPDVEHVATTSTLEEAHELIVNHKPDLAFLDIKIGTKTVFDLLEKLDEIDFEIIFITAYEDYAIKAIKFMAIDYLLKPVDIDDLVTATKKALVNIEKRQYNEQLQFLLKNWKQKDNRQHKIALSTVDSLEFIEVRKILYCKADGSYTRFFLADGSSRVVSRNLKYYEQLLADYNFYRPHNSVIVNLDNVHKVIHTDGGAIEMIDGQQLPISRSRKNELIDMLS